jgi:hypothetical protein
MGTVDVAIQHHVAHHENIGAAKQAHGGGQIGVRFGKCGLGFGTLVHGNAVT